jgi:hypothetical protein
LARAEAELDAQIDQAIRKLKPSHACWSKSANDPIASTDYCD